MRLKIVKSILCAFFHIHYEFVQSQRLFTFKNRQISIIAAHNYRKIITSRLLQTKCTYQYLQIFLGMNKKKGPFTGKTFNGYYIDQYLSSGNFAVVYKCYQINSSLTEPEYLAIKIYDDYTYEEVKEYVQFQIKILMKIKSPYVIKCHGTFDYQDENSRTLHCVLLQYCNGGTLKDFFEANKEKNNERLVRKFLKQILEGVKSIHQADAMHRDIKGQNIMLHEGIIKIVDFGLGKGAQGKQVVGQTYAGTPHNMAPQIKKVKQNKGGKYDKNVDIYSIGMVAYQMLEGNFYKEKKSQLQFVNMQVSSSMLNFLQGCLEDNPKKRFTWEQIMSHPIYTSSGSSIIKISRDDEFNFLLRSSNDSQKLPVKDSVQSIQSDSQYRKVVKKQMRVLDVSKISQNPNQQLNSSSQDLILTIAQNANKSNQYTQIIDLDSSKVKYPSIHSIASDSGSSKISQKPKKQNSQIKKDNLSQKNSDVKKKSISSYNASQIVSQIQLTQKFQQLYKKCNEERDRLIYTLDQTFSIDGNFNFFQEIDDSQYAKFQFFSYKKAYISIKEFIANLNMHKNILNTDQKVWAQFCLSKYFKNLLDELTQILKQLRNATLENVDDLQQQDEKLMKQADPDNFYINQDVFQKWYLNILKITYEDLVSLFDQNIGQDADMKNNDLIKICSILLYDIENKLKESYAYDVEKEIAKSIYRNQQYHKDKVKQFRKNTTFEFLYPKA